MSWNGPVGGRGAEIQRLGSTFAAGVAAAAPEVAASADGLRRLLRDDA